MRDWRSGKSTIEHDFLIFHYQSLNAWEGVTSNLLGLNDGHSQAPVISISQRYEADNNNITQCLLRRSFAQFNSVTPMPSAEFIAWRCLGENNQKL